MTAATNNLYETGIRKAAILVASLDPATADQLLEQLAPERAEVVRQAVMDLGEIDAEGQRQVIDELRRIEAMIPGKCPPGIELDGPLVHQMGQPESLLSQGDVGAAVVSEAETSAPPPPFGFLHEAEEEKLSQLLACERPQTIALVLSHLPPQQAGEVLSRFAAPLQVDIVRRLVDLENTDPETLREVEQAVEARLSKQLALERGRAGRPETVAKILASCDGRVAGTILANLAAYDRPLAERLGGRPLAFDDLVGLDDAVLLAIFRAAEPEVAQLALFGAPPQLVERILGAMAPKKAKSLRRKLDHPGPIRLSDVEEARRQLAALAQSMSHNNRNPAKAAFAA